MVTIALGIPHTPWIPERVQSMRRVTVSAAAGGDFGFYREFSDRESNKVWPLKMWRWGLDTGADWFLTIQDDTLSAPCLWDALRAMLTHVGARAVLGLSAVHPLGPTVARAGHRWYRTQSWLVGWGYAIRRSDLSEFVSWVDSHPEAVAKYNEDEMLNVWISETGRFTWHPVPTILDHDTSIASQYANDNHTHRRATVTWRDYGEGSLTDPDFWLPSGEPQLLPVAWVNVCWHCGKEPSSLRSAETGAYIGKQCLANMLGAILGRLP